MAGKVGAPGGLMKKSNHKGEAKMKTKTKLTAVLTLALAGAFAAVAQQQSLTGVVTDSMCGATHMAKDKTPAECTKMCVKDGMKYALSADKKLYTLERHEADLAKLAGPEGQGHRDRHGDTLTVASVTAAK